MMKNKMRSISRDVMVIGSDSSERIQSKNKWLPGGTVNIMFGQAAALIRKRSEKRDFLGRWSSFILEVNQKALMIITIYRIPDSTALGILKSKAQYNRKYGVIKTTNEYRKILLKEIGNKIMEAKQVGIDDILVSGDFN